jgi:hypothetical protein
VTLGGDVGGRRQVKPTADSEVEVLNSGLI